MSTDVPRNSSGNLVKSLLFPSFVDSGANDTFSSGAVTNNTNNTSTESVISDASTEIKHNLSVPRQKNGKQKTKPSIDHDHTVKSTPAAAPPSFFASTKPSVTGIGPTQSFPPPTQQEPMSPPIVSRCRSLSQSSAKKGNARNTKSDDDNNDDSKQAQEAPPEFMLGDVQESSDYGSSKLDISTLAHAGCGDDDSELLLSNQRIAQSGSTSSARKPGESAQQLIVNVSETGRDIFRWEEEATPAQTAFGKELMFRRDEYNRQYKQREHGLGSSEDVLSTASEQGTVVSVNHRLAELEDLQQYHSDHAGDAENDGARPDDRQIPSKVESDLLSVPRLASIRDASRRRQHGIEEEKKLPDFELSATAENLLTKTIRRIGSFRDTAPSTPKNQRAFSFTPQRALNEQYDKHEHPTNSKTPASFLLRSPGSAMHEAARHEQWESRHRRRLLSPRSLLSRNPGQDDKGGPDVLKDDSWRDSLGAQVTRPFLLARGCFSFDTFDTTMDDEFEIPNLEALQQHTQPLYRGSSSWDATVAHATKAGRDTGGAGMNQGLAPSIPFRPRGSHIRHRDGQTFSKSTKLPFTSPERSNTMPNVWTTPKPGSTTNNDTIKALKSPDRLEIEREDALDILACLVERGIALKTSESSEDCRDVEVELTKDNETKVVDPMDITDIVKQLKELSARHKGEGEDACSHEQRLLALDELVRSYQYASEMKRVSVSASSWLKSVGRSTGTIKDDMDLDAEATSESQMAGESASEGLDLLTCRAMLHSAQLDARENYEYAERLNKELASCKAEIGRLKTAAASTSGSFRSPNRSILDEDENSAAEEVAVCGDNANVSFGDASPILSAEEMAEDLRRMTAEGDDVSRLQQALDNANATIRELFADVKRAKGLPVSLADAPVVELTGANLKRDRYAETVCILDAENYITDWGELDPPLPPPPEHDIRSPIVVAVLDQWTSDTQLQESLLSWIESALSDEDPSTIPPLVLSSLDPQVRDGFVTHVLPSLLRRPDIRVDVKTRVHRSTTHDLSVTVESISKLVNTLALPRRSDIFAPRHESSADSTTHSTSTTLISNTNKLSRRFTFDEIETQHDYDMKRASSRLSYDEMADAPLLATPGIMGTLGGALGYLSSLRKGTPGTPRTYATDTPNMRAILEQSPNRPSEDGMNFPVNQLSDSDDVTMHPFHRVLSAPAGRLCITFVEYRGHAVVSDVAPDSPLAGFIFPSDVLIAIDEQAVSGMRIREIIKLLKDRSHKQRALRVISSHDMAELTLHTSMVNDGAD